MDALEQKIDQALAEMRKSLLAEFTQKVKESENRFLNQGKEVEDKKKREERMKFKNFDGGTPCWEDFIEHFEYICAAQGIEGKEKIKHFALSLPYGTLSQEFFENLPEATKSSFEQLKKEFNKQFGDKFLDVKSSLQLCNLQQGSKEPILHFIMRLEKIISRLFPNPVHSEEARDRMKKTYFLVGAQNYLKKYFLEKPVPNDWADVVSTARKIEAAHKLYGLGNDSLQLQSIQLVENQAAEIAEIKKLVLEMAENQARKDESEFCAQCGYHFDECWCSSEHYNDNFTQHPFQNPGNLNFVENEEYEQGFLHHPQPPFSPIAQEGAAAVTEEQQIAYEVAMARQENDYLRGLLSQKEAEATSRKNSQSKN